jgi:hypothetical protein
MAFPRNFCILVLHCGAAFSLAVQLNHAQAEQQTSVQLDGSHSTKMDELSNNATVHPIWLGYKHMSKCGGVFVNNIIQDMADQHRFIGEVVAVTPERKRNVFLIASTRNPCDYYVSLWAYQHRKPFAAAQNKQFGFFDFGGHSKTNATKFRSWLSWVQGPRFSVMSTRFWETLIAEKDGLSCWKDSLGSCSKHLDDAAVDRDFRKKGFKDAVDCWVYVETFTRDLRYCLHKYEQVSGVKLDWKPFDAMDEIKHNPSDHGVCEDYYTPEAEASVMRTDRRLFEAFGYTTCCGPATHPLN